MDYAESYKYNYVQLGISDIASLTVRFCCNMQDNYSSAYVLSFGSDGFYKGYVVDENKEIPDFYELALEGKNWVKIYDDDSLVYEVRAKKIQLYRAGDFSCVIRLTGEEK